MINWRSDGSLFLQSASSNSFYYFHFLITEWDNLFASLMASLFDKDIAYSNLFVSLRSKTPDGFLPNWSTAGGIRSSADRTEPPVGAKILLELYKKFKDEWIVEE